MLSIPFKALRIGAETLNNKPVKYNKTRISGSNKTTYNLHIRGASMPGQKNKFTTTSNTKPKQNSNLISNTIMSSYKRDKLKRNPRIGIMTKMIDNMEAKRKERIFKAAKLFLTRTTTKKRI